MAIRYLGSKVRVVRAILDIVGEYDKGTFVDGFSGTGSVAVEAASRGWPVLANDFLVSSAVITRAALTGPNEVLMAVLGGYHSVLEQLNGLEGVDGFITKNYSPYSVQISSQQRMYFTVANASKIDAIRNQIDRWRIDDMVTNLEADVLLSDLVHAANSVANTAGTYGYFLSSWHSNALSPLKLIPSISVGDFKSTREVSNVNVYDLKVEKQDTLYLDPPYTKRQYAAYYHIPETIVRHDAPDISGKSGLRPWKEFSSDFCYKRKVLPAFRTLLDGVNAERTFISYSREAHVSEEELTALLRSYGEVTVHELGSVSRYAPNESARENGSYVDELLFELKRT